MTSEVAICNRALDKIGIGPIVSFDEDSKAARACSRNYEGTRDQVLRDGAWGFATGREQLAASAVAPKWGYNNAFPLPDDFMRMLECETDTLPWDIETHEDAKAVVTDASAPLNIRYVRKITNPVLFDPLFIDALAMLLAAHLVESLQPSNSNKQTLLDTYLYMIGRAKHADGREGIPRQFEPDAWVRARL